MVIFGSGIAPEEGSCARLGIIKQQSAAIIAIVLSMYVAGSIFGNPIDHIP
tara:strand:+ start:40675 stop:40827 length:153 start_codon:yes stop_codon:yes gene_type:complete